MSSIIERLKSQSTSSRPGRGRAVSVYDGRSWPVIKCGAVYVTDADKTKHVTKNIVAQSAALDEKKKRASKYSLAVGSSFGHVHSFLKDSDHVLQAIDQTKAEDKCLMLIRKPKSASKQMLKAHSWANLSAPDMHLRRPDGSLKPNPIPKPKRTLRPSADLTLPRDQTNRWPQTSANQKSPNKPLPNHSASFKELSTVVEQQQQEESNSEVLPWEQKKSDEQNGNSLSYSFPSEQHPTFSSFGRAVSSIDLRHTTPEDHNSSSNIKMGGAFSKSQEKSRPKGPPPPVPSKGYKNSNKQQKVEYHNNNNTKQMHVYSVDNDPRRQTSVKSRPDVISYVHDKNVNRQGKENVQIAHAKSDSGFYSETRISSDEMYDYGFKQELDKSNGHMTSSPRSEKENVYAPQKNGQTRQNDRKVQNSQCKMAPEPQAYPRQSSAAQKNISPAPRHLDDNRTRMRNEKPDNRNTSVNKDGYIKSEKNVTVNKENNSRSGIRTNNARSEKVTAQRHPGSPYYDGKNYHSQGQTRHDQGQSRQGQSRQDQGQGQSRQDQGQGQARQGQGQARQGQGQARQDQGQSSQDQQTRTAKATASPRPKSDYNRQNIQENHRQGQRPSPVRETDVMRARSMGDLSAGCTFSLVGQKRNETVEDSDNVGLTGSQLAEHFRKYRKIKQESKHGSLPFRGKSVDDADVRGRLDEVQYNQPSSFGNAKPQKAMHYGSLQHLPLSSAENGSSDHRQLYSAKYREKTPMKPRRSLPQVPGDVDERKKHLSEVVKTRICGSSRSNSSPSSGGSNRASEVRVGGVSATPSDREVSVLTGSQTDIVWVPPQNKKPVCNTSSSDSNHRQVLPPDGYYSQNYQTYGTAEIYAPQEHSTSGFTAPSGGRLSESGQTTLTSQSTIDSGYITNDPDQDLSTSNYAKSVKQSAQNLYSSNKMFQPAKGDHSQGNVQTSNKGHNPHSSRERGLSSKQAKESRTRNWLDKHPGSYIGDHLKMGLNASDSDLTKSGQYDKTDTNNNRDIKYAQRNVTELDLTANVRPKETATKPHALMHHLSDPSGRESDKSVNAGDIRNFKCKGMSISMSQGLNMIEKNSRVGSGSFLSKSQPKFTGSLKDLLGADKQIVPIEALRGDNPQLNSTLPVNWKMPQRPETSLKLLGKPSLFQMLQNYNLYAVRMKIPEGFNIVENIRMIECEVVLPAVSVQGTSGQLTSPKGNYAKIGGPFSAFKPVSTPPSNPIRSVSMVTVMDLSSQLQGLFEAGSMVKGDLVVEVNERLMVGEDLSSLTALLQECQGEVLWTIARDRARESQQTRDKENPTNEEGLRQMEHTINELSKELRKKDRTLKQLNALLPWKQTNGKDGGEGRDQDPYICTLSEDEFIV